MRRRDFTKLTSMGAIAVSAFSFLSFNGSNYIADCDTTSDILGPFYRPDSPVRNNLIVPGKDGVKVKLKGKVCHKDCVTPFENAKVELWHCSSDMIYDNESDDFMYRGTTFCNAEGDYEFITHMPVPYDAGGGEWRPAHFHLLVSAPGYQSLVTQIYFKDDEYLDDDPSSNSAAAQNRILEVKNGDDHSIVEFNVTMKDKFLVTPESLERIVGEYKNEKSGNSMIFFKHEGQLWLKNELFGLGFDYIGDNTFTYPGTVNPNSIRFEIKKDGKILAHMSRMNAAGEKSEAIATKV